MSTATSDPITSGITLNVSRIDLLRLINATNRMSNEIGYEIFVERKRVNPRPELIRQMVAREDTYQQLHNRLVLSDKQDRVHYDF